MIDGSSLDFDQLKQCSLFGGVTEEAFACIRPFIEELRFEAGAEIVSEGEVNDRIYFIETGSVEVCKRGRSGTAGRELVLTTLGAGDTFGEMELIDIQRCAATVRAVTPTVTLTLSNHDLYKVSKQDMKTYALLVMNLAREISRRLRQMDDLIAGSGCFDSR